MMQMVYMMDSFLMIRWLSWAFRLELRARREGHWYNKIKTCRGESKIVDHAQFSVGSRPLLHSADTHYCGSSLLFFLTHVVTTTLACCSYTRTNCGQAASNQPHPADVVYERQSQNRFSAFVVRLHCQQKKTALIKACDMTL